MESGHDLTRRVIDCAIEVHRLLGPGLLEAIHESCLCYELAQIGPTFVRQQRLPVTYKGQSIDCDLRIDLIVAEALVVEIKAVQQPLPVHEARLLTYLRVSGLPLSLLMNLQGIRRRALTR
jgi:GxxExxY protein